MAASAGLTSEQRAALETRETSISLSAGAGCGKTYVLTRRFLTHLDPELGLPPARLDELVAITFTERAAREMRDRIRAVCRERLLTAPLEHAGYWRELLRGIDAARVSTIHSFCGSLLRAHVVEARLDPRFEILDPPQSLTLLAGLISDCLRSELIAHNDDALNLAHYSGITRTQELIADLLEYRHELDFEAWGRRTPDSLVELWTNYRDQVALPAGARLLLRSTNVRRLLRLIETHRPTNTTMLDRATALFDLLPRLAGDGNVQELLREIILQARVQGGGGPKAWAEREIYVQVKERLEELRGQARNLLERVDFDHEAALHSATRSLEVCRLAGKVHGQYELKKAELGRLDFDDLIVRALRLLRDPAMSSLRQRLSDQICLLLVDEFQDTDPLQAELVRLMCGDVLADEDAAAGTLTAGKLFFVGDHKQSIYRFRGADPTVFHTLRERLPEPGRLRLSMNFRSQPAILNFVNYLFLDDLATADPYEPLQAAHPQVTAEPAVEFLWAVAPSLPNKQLQDEANRAATLRRREAEWIARRVRALLESPEPLVHETRDGATTARRAQPGDVALLFRAMSNVDFYERALREQGIDYYVVGGHAFYTQQEIYDIVNLLQTLNRSSDEISLAGALRSPLFNLSDEALYWLVQEAGSLSAGLMSKSLPVQLDREQQQRVQFAAATLTELRRVKDRLPIASLIRRALDLTGYDAVIVAEFLGERKLANLHKLLDLARSFDQSGIFTLDQYITQLSQFVVKQPKEALAATHPETGNVVRLMSIHQSKGLEFPIVVVPDLERWNASGMDSVAYDPQLGPLAKVNGFGGKSAEAPGLDLFRMMQQDADEAEVMRLLYVACTRAADYLLLSAGLKNLAEPASLWMQLLERRFELLTGDCQDQQAHDRLTAMLGTYAPPQVRVTLDEPPSLPPPERQSLTPLGKLLEQVTAAPAGLPPPLVRSVPPDALARRQYSVSRLKGTLVALDADPDEERSAKSAVEAAVSTAINLPGEAGAGYVPTDEDGSAADLGTLVHAVLETINFRDSSAVRRLVELQAQKLTAPGQPLPNLEVATELIERFLQSPRTADLIGAQQLLREVEFQLAWPPDFAATPDSLYFSGFIDCLYQDAAGRWIVLDYKTNRIAASQLPAAASEYEMQLLLYGYVSERVLQSPPAELVLHYLRPGAEHVIRWDDAARRRAVELIDHALDTVRNG